MIAFECQVCDFKDHLHLDRNNQVIYGEWGIRQINFKEGPLTILVCPECAGFEIDTVLLLYKKRIREGKFPNLH